MASYFFQSKPVKKTIPNIADLGKPHQKDHQPVTIEQEPTLNYKTVIALHNYARGDDEEISLTKVWPFIWLAKPVKYTILFIFEIYIKFDERGQFCSLLESFANHQSTLSRGSEVTGFVESMRNKDTPCMGLFTPV